MLGPQRTGVASAVTTNMSEATAAAVDGAGGAGGAGKGAGTAALQTAMDLRSKGVTADFDTLQRSVKAQMREANRQGATHTVVIGEEELANGTCQVKNLSTSEQKSLPFKELFEHLTAV